MRKRICFVFVATSLVLLLGALIDRTLMWYCAWVPSRIQDGPFMGIPRTTPTSGQPKQVLHIYQKFSLEVYAPTTNEPAPTVILKDLEGSVKWCVYACPDAKYDALVKDIEFVAWRRFPFKEPRVRGRVTWKYGNELTWWFISEAGELKGYWFSW